MNHNAQGPGGRGFEVRRRPATPEELKALAALGRQTLTQQNAAASEQISQITEVQFKVVKARAAPAGITVAYVQAWVTVEENGKPKRIFCYLAQQGSRWLTEEQHTQWEAAKEAIKSKGQGAGINDYSTPLEGPALHRVASHLAAAAEKPDVVLPEADNAAVTLSEETIAATRAALPAFLGSFLPPGAPKAPD